MVTPIMVEIISGTPWGQHQRKAHQRQPNCADQRRQHRTMPARPRARRDHADGQRQRQANLMRHGRRAAPPVVASTATSSALPHAMHEEHRPGAIATRSSQSTECAEDWRAGKHDRAVRMGGPLPCPDGRYNISSMKIAELLRGRRRERIARGHAGPFRSLFRRFFRSRTSRHRPLAADRGGDGVPDGGGGRHHAADRVGPVHGQMGADLRRRPAADRPAMAGGVRRLQGDARISRRSIAAWTCPASSASSSGNISTG